MAVLPRELSIQIAGETGQSLVRVRMIDRALLEAGMRKSTGHGMHSASMGPLEAATVLLTVIVAEAANESPKALQETLKFSLPSRFEGEESEEEHRERIGLAAFEKATGRRFDASCNVLDIVTAIFEHEVSTVPSELYPVVRCARSGFNRKVVVVKFNHARKSHEIEFLGGQGDLEEGLSIEKTAHPHIFREVADLLRRG